MIEYQELYASIWKQAVQDDIDRAIKHLTDKGRWAAFDAYCLKVDEEDISIEDKRFKKIFADIKAYSKFKARKLGPRIKQLVYEEAQEWPNNKQLNVIDPEYKDLMAELEQEVKEFSETRMLGLWRRLK
ncbi:hypothetical protein [Gudongella sp. SC589]|uniref:hypothetical protein n=1 Tax=Gudongella sp. SC589 TaxID=3385990 RepID=UPI003904C272